MSIVIADDHERERVWLKELLLKNFSEHFPILEASNGELAFELACKHRPSMAFLDIEMPVLSGMKAAEKILKALPQTGIMILSNHSEEVWVRQLWRIVPASSVFAYILKDAKDEQIIEATRAVLGGDCWIHPRIQRIMLQNKSGAAGNLSEGELEVLAHLCTGLTDRAISRRLYLTEKAIQARLRSLYTKLGMPLKGSSDDDRFNHRCRAVNVALRRGLVTKTQMEEWESSIAET